MSSLSTYTPGYGYLSVAVCFLLLCPPSSYPALVFPNDVLASLDKYKSSNTFGYEHGSKAATSPVIPSPSYSSLSSQTASSLDAGKDSLPVGTALTRHSYPSVPEGSLGPNGDILGDLFGQEDLDANVFPSILSHSEDTVDDYDDYSDYPSPPPPLAPGPSLGADELHASSVLDLSSHHNGSETVTRSHEDSESDADRDTWRKGDREVHVDHSDDTGTSGRHVRPPADELHSGKGAEEEEEHKKQCPRCKIRDEDRAYRIESLKRKILESLHFTTLPNRTGMPVPKALAHMSGIHTDLLQDAPYGGIQHQYYDDEDDDDYTPPERLFTTAKSMPQHLQRGEENACYFTIPTEATRARVTKAYLWFYVKHASDVHSPVLQMRVDRLGPPSSRRLRSGRRLVWSQKAKAEKAFGWKRVEVTNVVRRWVKHPSSNYGLDILATDGTRNLAVLPPASEKDRGYEPLLDIKVSKDGKRRYRRSDSLTCTENTSEHRCCRYPLTVSFAEFGWEWVIAPTHVKADYCSGECRMTLQNKTPYSWIASQTPEGGSCCTPSKMTALPLLYFDQHGDVVFQMLQNMRVERCGCA